MQTAATDSARLLGSVQTNLTTRVHKRIQFQLHTVRTSSILGRSSFAKTKADRITGCTENGEAISSIKQCERLSRRKYRPH